MAYTLNLHDLFDLDNYLRDKPINVFDILRGVFYQIWTKCGFTNKYRYDHIISKWDGIYEFEKIKILLSTQKNQSGRLITDYVKIFKAFNQILGA